MIDPSAYVDEDERAVKIPTTEACAPDRRVHVLGEDGAPRCHRLEIDVPVVPVEDQEFPFQDLCLYCFPRARDDLMARVRSNLGISPETKTKEVKAGTNG